MRVNNHSAGSVRASGHYIGNHGSHGSHTLDIEGRSCTRERSTTHSLNNLEPMARLAEYARKPGFIEALCLPDGTYTSFEIEKSVLRPRGSYWLIWRPCRNRNREKAQPPLWVTSTALRPAMPYADWMARQARTASLI